MHVAAVNGQTLHYDIAGPETAPPIVLINSLGTDFRLWDRFVAHLQGAWRIVRYDKRGHGLSGVTAGPYAMEDHAADLSALLDHLGLHSAVLCGVSIGGMIAQALTAVEPQRVRALILCDTAGKIADRETWNARIAAVEAGGVEAVAAATMGRWFPPPFHEAHSAEVAGWRAMLTRQPVDGYIASMAALREADLRSSGARLTMQTLVMVGSEDLSTPPSLVAPFAASLPSARYVVIDGAGHLPMIDAPDVVAGHVNAFLPEALL